MHRHFYFPDRIHYGSPADAGLRCEDVRFPSRDGTVLAAWFMPADGDAQGTVVHLHGNAQNMSAHWIYTGWLPACGFNLLTFDYRGYGQSHGTPDPQGLLEDAIAAFDYLRGRADIAAQGLYVFGQSLGGMLAIAAAGVSPHGIRAVAAEAPAYSYSTWADDQMPELQLTLDDACCAGAYVARLAPIPLLLLHSRRDRVVPYEHSQRLYAEAGEPKQLVTIADGAHNDAMTDVHGEHYRELLSEFFKRA